MSGGSGKRDPGGDDFAEAARLLASGPLLRAVNFHHTPPARESDLDALLAKLARHFSAVSASALEDYARTGRWTAQKPGIVPAFYNGYRSNFDVAAPLLDKHGLTGWFFVVTGFADAPAQAQAAYAAEHGMGVPAGAAGRIALSWDEIGRLGERHVIASHSRSHAKPAGLSAARLLDEAQGAQEDFELRLGRGVEAIAWASGTAYGESTGVDRAVEAANHRFVFSNLRVQMIEQRP